MDWAVETAVIHAAMMIHSKIGEKIDGDERSSGVELASNLRKGRYVPSYAR